jgi:prevent-host-death family protein
MNINHSKTWTIAEAKAKLSEILRLADEQGPQRIGARKTFVIVSEADWLQRSRIRQPLGSWLADRLAEGGELQLPDRRDPPRPLPFEEEQQP